MKALQKNKENQRGAAALLTVFIALVVLIVGLLGSAAFVFNERQISRNFSRSLQSYYTGESGIEDAVYRVRNNKQYTANYTLAVNQTSTAVNISGTDTKTITSLGSGDFLFRNLQSKVKVATTSAQFFYGVQVGEGGVVMRQNSKIQGAGGGSGNFYSNGPIAGENGSIITGDVTVATGIVIDAQHTVYNSDFSFGQGIGSSIVTVDSGGEVGEYGFFAFGTDGFARISYYDEGNKDLKFARCTNADCSARTLTTVDSVGDVGERYTSVAIASTDGFARISYYDKTNGDLKFVRCTNADCTTKNIAVVDTANGQYSSLALGSDGFARISYYSGDLKFVRCTNDDCTTRVITTIDNAGDIGQYTSLVIGPDGFVRISYVDITNKNLKFVRCTNADCTTRVITTVDNSGKIHRNTSLVMDSDGFARISYMNDTDNHLKYARCTNVDCTTSVITTVATDGGAYSSIKMGPDGFPRISYYTGDLKYVRCTDADCATKVITTPDSAGDTGRYASLNLSAEGFGRMSYYDASNKDLKYARCANADCAPPVLAGDAAQSFIPSQSKPLAKVSIYIRKIGNPSDATIRINTDNAGSPATSSLASASVSASLVTTSYGWIDATFSSPPNLTSGTTYWLVFDGNQDAANYYVWGYDNANGYGNGVAKYSEDWSSKPWFLFNGDMNFKTYLGTGISSIGGVIVYGTVRANTITNSEICGDAYYQSVSSIDSSSKNFLDNPTNPTCGGNPLTPGTGFPNQPDPPVSNLPISQANIDQWKADAAAGGTVTGDYSVTTDVSLGPKKITGNLFMTSSNKTLMVTGTLHVQGSIDISNGSRITCAASFGSNSCIVVADGWIHISNNGSFSGSGQAGSYIMFLTTLSGCNGGGQQSQCTHHNTALDLHNNATGAIFYAQNSMVNLHNGVNVSELTAYKLELNNNAVVTYEQGLSNAQFSSGPSGGFDIIDWQEIP